MSDEAQLGKLRRAVEAAGIGGEFAGPTTTEDIPAGAGAYVLMLRLEHSVAVRLARREVTISAGDYVYCGSARGPGGLRARLARHFRPEKKPHWHVDHLTSHAVAMAAIAIPGADECALTARLESTRYFQVEEMGFGSSDCRDCQSHLLRFDGG